MKKRTTVFMIGMMILLVQGVQCQTVFGKWKTIDDRTGNPKAIVEIFEEGGRMYGHIVKILEKGKENAKCIKCDGEQKNEPIVGMTIIEGAKKNDDGEWKGKKLFDPEQGMTFRCKIWLNPENPDQLKVRDYLAVLYRTQTWLRVKG